MKPERLTFHGIATTTDVYFSGAGTFDFDPVFLGGSIMDTNFIVDVAFSPDLSTGSIAVFDSFFSTLLDGSLVDTILSVDNGFADDTFSMLFEISTGATAFAIATFTGDLDGFGFSDFSTDGVLFSSGALQIVGGVSESAAVVPLPAGVVLLLTGLAAFGGLGAARRNST